MYKTVNEKAPSYLTRTLPEPQPIAYNLRNADNVKNIRGRTVAFDNSFFPKTIKEWNDLPDKFKEAPSSESFSARMDSNKKKVPNWYTTGIRRPSILHARLRMLCSPLNDHLYSLIHVVDSPACQCGHARENNKHFLLHCPLYVNERTEMLAKLELLEFQPTLMNLLFGNEAYEENININAFQAVQEFILKSERFQ